MSKPKPEAVALKAARALSVQNPPGNDWCGFAHDVGHELFKLGNERRRAFNLTGDKTGGPLLFVAHYLALGILDAEAQHRAELDEKFSAEDVAKRERIRELIRLVTIDGRPVT